MRILITGAGGYIGTSLVDLLSASGYTVVALDRYLFGDTIEEKRNVKVIKDDIRTVESNVLNGIDVVVDLAALSNDPSGELSPVITESINHLGRLRIAALSKAWGVKKYILPSSCSVYGFNENEVDESSAPNPLTTYAKANLNIERDALKLSTKDFSVTVLRLATVYGLSERRMRFDLVLNDILGQAFTKGWTFLTTGGKQWRPFIHVMDVCKAIKLTIEADFDLVNGEVFNVGSGAQNFQILEAAKLVFDGANKESKYQWKGSPDTRSYHVSFEKIFRVLNFSPDYSIEKSSKELWKALELGTVRYGDPKTVTVEWYKHLISTGVDL